MATYLLVAAALRRHKQAIMQTWMQLARQEIPAAPLQDRLALLDSLPDFIDNLAATLECGPNWEEKAREARLGTDHGRQRFLLEGYTLRQVIVEYQLMRRVFFDLLMPELSTMDAVHIINGAVDTAITNAADTFATAERSEDRQRMGQLQGERDASLLEAREQETFVATLSHDLKNPLGSVQMAIDLLVPELTTADQSELAEMVQNGVAAAQVLVTDLLDVYQVKAGKGLPITPERMDLASFIRGYVAQQEVRYGKRFRLLAPMPVVGYWCSKALRRLCDNLITNAIKYGAKDETITLTLSQQGASTNLSVHNVGPAIPAAELPVLFEPFVRANAATKSRHEGWGLGLAIVSAVASAHGGSVAVNSVAPSGTTFTVTLPTGTSSGPA